MSRPIKFRAWTHQNPPMQWFSKNVAITGNGEQMTPIGGTFTGIWHTLGDRDEGLIIEQYTGLKDKNGKEIYEGDRIKIEGSDCVYTVEYGRGVWVARFGDDSGDNICLSHYVQKDMVLYAEVIGNIHENPEMIGGEE